MHQYASGHMSGDYHGDLAYPADDMYQGEILLGNYRQPSFSNGQQNVLYTGPNGAQYPEDGNIVYDDVPLYWENNSVLMDSLYCYFLIKKKKNNSFSKSDWMKYNSNDYTICKVGYLYKKGNPQF